MTTEYRLRDAQVVIDGFAAPFAHEDFRAELDRLARGRLGWGRLEEIRLQPLKAHPRRCAFDVAVRTRSGWHGLIGKVHAEDRSELFRRMEALAQAGFGADEAFSIPQPVAYLPALHVLLEEKVAGRPALEIFADATPRERMAAAERCAQWLARLHTVGPRLGPVADLTRKLVRARYWRDQLVAFGEPFASRARRLLGALEAVWPGPATGAYRASHGSYIPEHVLFGPGRTVVIDLDEYDLAPPSRDVAWFVVALQRLALRRHDALGALDKVVKTFLKTYAAAGEEGALAHLAFYRALECLHRARNDLVKPSPPARERAETMLEEGLRLC